jgi:hypothetical protein
LAQKVVVQLVDDIDGTPIEPGTGSTVTFALDGANYEIDLADRNAERLRDALAPYVTAGRRVGGRRTAGRGSGTPAPASEATAMREWARSRGMKVSERGRVGSDVVVAYGAAH